MGTSFCTGHDSLSQFLIIISWIPYSSAILSSLQFRLAAASSGCVCTGDSDFAALGLSPRALTVNGVGLLILRLGAAYLLGGTLVTANFLPPSFERHLFRLESPWNGDVVAICGECSRASSCKDLDGWCHYL